MSERSRGVLPLVLGAGLQLFAAAVWALQWLWSLPGILQEPLSAWCWQPQFDLANAIDGWTAGRYSGAGWVLTLVLVIAGPQVASSVSAGVLGLVTVARGRGAVRVGGLALTALTLPLLAWAVPTVLGGVFLTLFAANPKVW